MSKEFKHYELKSSPRPLHGGRYDSVLSTVSILGADEKKYYCYVSFSDKLVYKVGKVLPYGASPLYPAFLFVSLVLGEMVVSVKYVQWPAGKRLWTVPYVEQDIPAWLKFIPVKGSK